MQLNTNPTSPSGNGSNPGPATPEGGAALAQSKDDLMRELRNLIRDGEALLRATTNLSGEALAQAREQFRGQLATARTRVSNASRVAIDQGRRAAVATDEYVHANPWPAIGVAAGIGFVIGAILSRR